MISSVLEASVSVSVGLQPTSKYIYCVAPARNGNYIAKFLLLAVANLSLGLVIPKFLFSFVTE